MDDDDQPGFDLDKVSQDLNAFLVRNPSSKIELGESDGKPALVQTPWGDPSVAFVISKDQDTQSKLNDALNGIYLPPRLSAIYHVELRQLEIIFTARVLSENLKEVDGRKFDFTYEEKVYSCSFDGSSDTLLTIADAVIFPQNSDSAFRNLASFSDYLDLMSDIESLGDEQESYKTFIKSQYGRPLSFFISNVDWEEDETLVLLRHISFFLRYFDSISPFIVIHPPVDTMAINPKIRYVHGKFPESIISRKLNPSLLSFYLASADALPENKFLYCFRIIEFVASHYLKNEKLNQVRKVLSNPALPSSIEQTIDSLVGLIREDKPDSTNRFKAVVHDLTNREVIWGEIRSNPDAFANPVKFDGGFEIPKLVDGVDDISRLGPTSIQAMAGIFKNIRNALAHGGEDQAGRVILPTARNAKLLQPWVHLIVVVAGEVILHEHHT